MARAENRGGQAHLSRRELEIAGLVADGLTNREIASRLFISERTVDGHLEHVREKLGVNTRAQIASWVARQGAATATATASHPAPAATPTPHPKLLTHPRAWLAATLLLALMAAGTASLRLLESPPAMIETVAGAECAVYPDGCYGGDGGFANRAGLARPTDVAVAANGSFYIADYANHRVRMVAGGRISTVAGGRTSLLDEGAVATSVFIGFASGVAVDGQGRLYVLTVLRGNLEVWRRNADTTMSRVAELGVFKDYLPPSRNLPVGGLAVTSDGTIYVADRAGNRVVKVVAGQESLVAGTGEAGFGGDHGAAVAARLRWPIGLALDKGGNLYIADAANNRIRKVDARGVITTIAGNTKYGDDRGDGGAAADARLSFPFGVAVAPDGSIAIADTGNQRVRRIVDGNIYPVAGISGRWGFNGDGPAPEAELSGPEAVTFDSKGDLFIADTENQRVREIPGLSPP
jgi:DNA-binding CsgD family transcriptional regulator/sugar lactone lactonase YvrE